MKMKKKQRKRRQRMKTKMPRWRRKKMKINQRQRKCPRLSGIGYLSTMLNLSGLESKDVSIVKIF